MHPTKKLDRYDLTVDIDVMSEWLSVPKKSGKHRGNHSIDLFPSDAMVTIAMTFASKNKQHLHRRAYLIIATQKTTQSDKIRNRELTMFFTTLRLLLLAVLESAAPLSSSLEDALYKCSIWMNECVQDFWPVLHWKTGRATDDWSSEHAIIPFYVHNFYIRRHP